MKNLIIMLVAIISAQTTFACAEKWRAFGTKSHIASIESEKTQLDRLFNDVSKDNKQLDTLINNVSNMSVTMISSHDNSHHNQLLIYNAIINKYFYLYPKFNEASKLKILEQINYYLKKASNLVNPPGYFQTELHLLKMHRYANKNEEAFKLAKRLVKKYPDVNYFVTSYAQMAILLNKNSEAYDEIIQAAEIQPHDIYIVPAAILANLYKGDIDNALFMLNRFIAENLGTKNTKVESFSTNMFFKLQFLRKDYQKIINFVKAAIKEKPNFPTYYAWGVKAYLAAGLINEESATFAENTLKHIPSHSIAMEILDQYNESVTTKDKSSLQTEKSNNSDNLVTLEQLDKDFHLLVQDFSQSFNQQTLIDNYSSFKVQLESFEKNLLSVRRKYPFESYSLYLNKLTDIYNQHNIEFEGYITSGRFLKNKQYVYFIEMARKFNEMAFEYTDDISYRMATINLIKILKHSGRHEEQLIITLKARSLWPNHSIFLKEALYAAINSDNTHTVIVEAIEAIKEFPELVSASKIILASIFKNFVISLNSSTNYENTIKSLNENIENATNLYRLNGIEVSRTFNLVTKAILDKIFILNKEAHSYTEKQFLIKHALKFNDKAKDLADDSLLKVVMANRLKLLGFQEHYIEAYNLAKELKQEHPNYRFFISSFVWYGILTQNIGEVYPDAIKLREMSEDYHFTASRVIISHLLSAGEYDRADEEVHEFTINLNESNDELTSEHYDTNLKFIINTRAEIERMSNEQGQ